MGLRMAGLTDELQEEKNINSQIRSKIASLLKDSRTSSDHSRFITRQQLNLPKQTIDFESLQQRDTDKLVESRTDTVAEAFNHFGKKIARLREVL